MRGSLFIRHRDQGSRPIPPNDFVAFRGRISLLTAARRADIFTGDIPGENMIQAFLFAANGVLVETHDLHTQALNEAMAPYGCTITPEENAETYRGLPTWRKLEILSDAKGLDPTLYDVIRAEKQKVTLRLIDEQIALDLEKIELLSSIKELGFKIAVCSNTRQEALVATMQAMGLYGYVDLCVGSDLGLEPKPAPDMYLQASDMLGVPMNRCAIVERTIDGIQAAKASGCPTIVRVKGTDEVNIGLLHFLMPTLPERRYSQSF